MSMPIPGDVLPLWNPDIPGEEITTGRLGIRVRPGTPAAAKVFALEAHGGAELLRQVLQEQKVIDGTYTIVKPEKPLEFIGQVSSTLLTGKLGRTPMGLALEISDWQELEGAYEMEKNRLRLGYQELHVVKEWDGDLEGFTAIVLREIDGLSYDDIAFSLGVAIGTVKSRLTRARQALRNDLRTERNR